MVQGEIRVVWSKFTLLEKQVEPRAAKIIEQGAQTMVTDMKDAIESGPKTGRLYRRGNVEHQASAPGEAPATDIGTLANSLVVKRVAKLTREIWGILYGFWLEFGTTTLLPRPFVRPAVDKNRDKLIADLEEIVKL